MRRVTIIGGGYGGTALAVHLSRQARAPLDIVLVEPRAEVGGGLAHSAPDPDHRLNAGDVIHLLYPDDDMHFRRWLETTGRLAADPEAWYADGRLYPRRGDFGAYLAAQFAAHAQENPSGSTLSHRRERAVSIERGGDRLRIELSSGDTLEADRCVIAIGQEPAPLGGPGSVLEAAGDRLIEDPFAPGALAKIDREAEVLIVGTGLTSADTVASLVGQGHTGPITCLSRRGLRPEDQNPEAAAGPLWDRIAVQPPPFLERYGLPETMAELARIVREEARKHMARGQPWHGAIDDVRDAAGEIWRALGVEEKDRFLRHLKPYYDSHRFRIPPQTRDILREAEDRGQLTFETGRIVGAETRAEAVRVNVRRRGETETRAQAYGAIVSCVGLASRVEHSRNPFVRSCLQGGFARPSDMGRGFETDDDGRALSARGAPEPGLYVIGTMTLDRFGETPAAIFILRQIFRMLPSFVISL